MIKHVYRNTSWLVDVNFEWFGEISEKIVLFLPQLLSVYFMASVFIGVHFHLVAEFTFI